MLSPQATVSFSAGHFSKARSGAPGLVRKACDEKRTMKYMLREWVVAGILALLAAAILDLLPVGESRILKCAGLVKNKLSEKSVARLKKRIEELEKYKKNVDLMLNSDKALYLNTFRAIFGTLLFMCIGAS
jgi:hypothetical protein